uniref:Lipoprotein n=1 Tax=Rhabditophanes sp. KR3021 TaxID=114890 RepID=A0AC35U303_9BILA
MKIPTLFVLSFLVVGCWSMTLHQNGHNHYHPLKSNHPRDGRFNVMQHDSNAIKLAGESPMPVKKNLMFGNVHGIRLKPWLKVQPLYISKKMSSRPIAFYGQTIRNY